MEVQSSENQVFWPPQPKEIKSNVIHDNNCSSSIGWPESIWFLPPSLNASSNLFQDLTENNKTVWTRNILSGYNASLSSRMSSCENFRGEASGGVNGIMYSALKKKWEMVGQQSLTYSYVVRGTGILNEYTEFTVDRVKMTSTRDVVVRKLQLPLFLT
ncbi:hypothetical protein CK203_054429 [Vitis vinifera]|uniref:Uncharacterized protein n=1 Tax=Vitis vinifera TaxID=29760 RepID=A0A438H042_VITVI|nr:hypothetical protein CK203_054429 [Vitis vinifera]